MLSKNIIGNPTIVTEIAELASLASAIDKILSLAEVP
jgi:hypothetical protein